MLGWASGGPRSEIVALNRDDLDLGEWAETGLIRLRLLGTKTTGPGRAPRLPLKERPARAVLDWLAMAGIKVGPLFRPISLSDHVPPRRCTPPCSCRCTVPPRRRSAIMPMWSWPRSRPRVCWGARSAELLFLDDTRRCDIAAC